MAEVTTGTNGAVAQHIEEKQEQPIVKAPKAPLAFMPSSWDDACRIAKYISQTGLTPDALRGKEWDILYIVATGHEYGLSPIQAIREIVIIKGKPYLSALLRIGMVKNSPVCEYFRMVESTPTHATFETKRRGEGVTKLTYTIEQARLAGLAGRKDEKGNLLQDQWNKDPALMLRRRCGSQLADEVYSDVTRGSRDREDLEDEREINPAPFHQVGQTYAPPAPTEAEVVPQASPPKKERKLNVVDVSTKADDAKDAKEPSAFDKICAALMEAQTVDQVDDIIFKNMNFAGEPGQRETLAKLGQERREAVRPKGKK